MEGPIRYFMVPVLLLMWVGCYWLWSVDLLNIPLIVGITIAHIICAIIFYHFMYVFNFGYAALMIVMPLVYALPASPSLAASVFLAVPILYGIRLGLFTWHRYRSESYADRAKQSLNKANAIPLPLVVVIWLFVSSLMFFVMFNAWIVASSDHVNVTVWLATVVMAIGLAIETIADRQKQDVKRINKDGFCTVGLYRNIRHPNYLGEIIFHMGLYWGMVSSSEQLYPLILGGLGTGWMLLMMYSQAAVLDRHQQTRYGDEKEFQDYRASTGMLSPRLF